MLYIVHVCELLYGFRILYIICFTNTTIVEIKCIPMSKSIYQFPSLSWLYKYYYLQWDMCNETSSQQCT